jgi:integrating conjugative element protein (TIGR03757 family)
MMRWSVLSSFLLILAFSPNHATANAITDIYIFHTNTTPVTTGGEVRQLPFNLTVHNMDATNNAVARLNTMVRSKLPAGLDAHNFRDANLDAFSEVQNGPQWATIYSELKAGGMATGNAMKFRIQKLPAIVINEKWVIYGVTSLDQAIRIFKQEGLTE